MNQVINSLKQGHCHVEVWHAHGPQDPGWVEGYYQGARWIRVTFYEDHCLVQHAVGFLSGRHVSGCNMDPSDLALEEPGMRLGTTDQDLEKLSHLMQGAKESCVLDRRRQQRFLELAGTGTTS
jgi:hypothetical protein